MRGRLFFVEEKEIVRSNFEGANTKLQSSPSILEERERGRLSPRPSRYMRSGTPIPSNPNPVFSTFAVTPASANLEERISPSDFRIGQAS